MQPVLDWDVQVQFQKHMLLCYLGRCNHVIIRMLLFHSASIREIMMQLRVNVAASCRRIFTYCIFRRMDTTSTMCGRSDGSCIKHLKLSFTTWVAYCIPPFSARPGPAKLRSSASAFGVSMTAAIVVVRSLSLPSCSKTGHLSVTSSSNTTPKAYTSTLVLTGPASRHSGCCQEEYCCSLHHYARWVCEAVEIEKSIGNIKCNTNKLVPALCLPGSSSAQPFPKGAVCHVLIYKVPRYPWSFIHLFDPKFLVAFFISEKLYTLRARSSLAISRIKSCGENIVAFLPLFSGICALFLQDRNKMTRRSNISREKPPAATPTNRGTLFGRLFG